jgi:hypothetical protein
MKRMTETEKWRDSWFRKLSPTLKIGYLYLLDAVDNAGVWDPDTELADWMIGTPVAWDELRSFAGERIAVLPNGKWWLTRFVRFQCGELSEDSRPHQAVARLLKNHGIEGYLKGIHTLQDKTETRQGLDKDKDKDSTGAESKRLRRPRPPKEGAVVLAQLQGMLQERLIDISILFKRRVDTTWTQQDLEAAKLARVETMEQDSWQDDVGTLWLYYRETKGEGELNIECGCPRTLFGKWSEHVARVRKLVVEADKRSGSPDERRAYATQDWAERRELFMEKLAQRKNSLGKQGEERGDE